ncbi:MAG: hypothetical protein ACI88G_002275, partial [Woeseiaceae bacterium]
DIEKPLHTLKELEYTKIIDVILEIVGNENLDWIALRHSVLQ